VDKLPLTSVGKIDKQALRQAVATEKIKIVKVDQ
jgi:non-ribosomal peptide synthetase component E (peptide arylation enzyme)